MYMSHQQKKGKMMFQLLKTSYKEYMAKSMIKNDIHKEGSSTFFQNRSQFIYFIAFLIAFAFLLFFLYTHMSKLLNSDDSSELILSKLLLDNKLPLSKDWFYSTELRVINTQLIYSFFFRIFQDWHLVRWFSVFAMIVIMLIANYYMLCQLGLKRCFLCGATILVLPFSDTYFNIVLRGAYYLPHITISFISIGLLEYTTRVNEIRKIPMLSMLALLAFLSGLGGPRQVIIMYFPAFLSGLFFIFHGAYTVINSHQADNQELVKKKVDDHNKILIFGGEAISDYIKEIPGWNWAYFRASLLAFVCSIFGYIMNTKVLATLYTFKKFNISFSFFSFKRLESVIYGFVKVFGFTNGEVISFSLINNSVSIIWFLLTVLALKYAICHYGSVDKSYFRIAIFTTVSYIFFTLLYLFSNLDYDERYNLPISVFSIPCILFWFRAIDRKNSLVYSFILLMLIGIRSIGYYNEINNTDMISERRKIVECLNENGYKNGYATFWSANILTELSNGNIEVWDWGDLSNDFDCIDRTYEWLQLKSHVYEHPTGKVFWVLNEEQKNAFHFTKGIPQGHIIYETPENINWDILDDSKKKTRYYVYGFSSYEEMYNLVGIYNSTNERIIGMGAETRSDVRTLYPDSYHVIIRGQNLSLCQFRLVYNPIVEYKGQKKVWMRPHELEADTALAFDDYMICSFHVDEKIANFQVCITNNGENNANIQNIKVMKNDVYVADFYSSKWLINGEDLFGKRVLRQGGISYGPYITLVPGTYVVECNGDDMQHISYDATYCENEIYHQFETKVIEQTNEHLIYEFVVEKTAENCEIRVFNNMEKDVELEGLSLRRKWDS